MARFFIHHPIFAWVLAIFTMLVGVIALFTLPIAQYPAVAPPSIKISAFYTGASAITVEESVTQVIEQSLTGIDNLLYMRATSNSDGSASITLTFNQGTDSDIAQVQVQNKLQSAIPLLPQSVQRLGVNVSKGNENMLMVVAIVSTDGLRDNADLTDYMSATVKDQLSRIPGVGSANVFGDEYAMRIWLDPNKLYNYKMTPGDVIAAIQAQNMQVVAGQLGALPAPADAQINVSIQGQSLLQNAKEFESILLRVDPEGRSVFIRDVARVEIGSASYVASARMDGFTSGAMGISLASGANALDTANAINAKLDAMKDLLPEGTKLVIPYDTTPPVLASIKSVVTTLLEAIILVFLVMYLFLQNIRATIIPTIAVPVVLLGTFAVLQILGYSINTLTLFAMVLAIGLLVDDAIVVVENVERVMAEENLEPLPATEKSMDQVGGALVGIVIVLSAVFVPMAFLGGSTGVIYRQFSVTIVTAMVLSVLVALILTPALCVTILRKHDHHKKQMRFFVWFNQKVDHLTSRYHGVVNTLIRRGSHMMLVYVGIVGLLGIMYVSLPTGYLPEEDQGLLLAVVQLPPNSTLEQTSVLMKKLEDAVLGGEGEYVASIMTVAGAGMGPPAQNVGASFISLKNWSERSGEEASASAIAIRLRQKFASEIGGMVQVFVPPAIIELGTSSGFTMEILDNAGLGHEKLIEARNRVMAAAFANPKIAYIRPTGLNDTVQYSVTFDNQKASSLGLSISDVSNTLSVMLGSSYVNDFVDRGRVKKVYVQADMPFRMTPDDLNALSFRNNKGEMVPFTAIAKVAWTQGPALLERYNAIPAVELQGEPVSGVSTGEAMTIMEAEVEKLGGGYTVDWTGLSYEEKLAGSQASMVLLLSALVVFLALAALYESWSIPFSVILVIPIGIFGAVLGTTIFGLSNDVYFQVGILATMGLSAKNAILVVEFAKELMEKEGKSIRAAASEAARLRLRPILMTSLAFGLGVVPMLLASGAGAASQHAVGTAVFYGTVTATVLGIFFIPVFFAVVAVAAGVLFKKLSIRKLLD